MQNRVESRAVRLRRVPRRKILLAFLLSQKPATLPTLTSNQRYTRIESRWIGLRRIPRRKILLSYLLKLHPVPIQALLYRSLQTPYVTYPKPVYPKRRKPIYLLEFSPPPAPVAVPNVVGLTLANAVSAIGGVGLTVGTETSVYSATVPIGIIISQLPLAGSPVAAGTPVSLVISLGAAPVQVTIPNVVGFPQASAQSILGAVGLNVGITTAVNPSVQVGNVISQSPGAGTVVTLPYSVIIVISIAQPVVTTWPLPSTITNLPVRGAWELPGGQQAVWVVGSGAFLMAVASQPTASTQATFALKRIGTLLTSTGPVCIRDNGAGGAVVFVDGHYGYYYIFGEAGATATEPVGSFYQITDPNFSPASRVCFIDGWWIFNIPGTQEFFTPTSTYSLSFNGTNFALKDGATDNLVTMYENKEELWLVGEKTTEIWYDAGGTYFAFERLVSTMLQVGCSAPASIARFEAEGADGLVWLAKTERGQNVVIKTQGFSAVVISTPAINHEFAKLTFVSDAIGYTYQEDGHEFYVLTFPTAVTALGTGTTWVYDNSTDMWHQRLSYEPYSQSWNRHRSNCFLSFQNQRLVGDYQNGSIYQMSRGAYTDNGWPLVAWRRAPHIWDGAARERVFMAFLQIDFKPGVGLQGGGMGINPQAFLQISRDGGTTWGQILTRYIGKAGKFLNRVIWRRLSFSRDAVIDVKVYDPVNRDIVGATLKKGEQ